MLSGKVERIAKSSCGRIDQQSPNLHQQFTLTQPIYQSNTVQVVSCPADMFVITSLKEVNVTWPEPLFISTNSKQAPLERVEQNLKSNQVFTWGEYTVLYVAYTNESTSAQCSFKVLFLELNILLQIKSI